MSQDKSREEFEAWECEAGSGPQTDPIWLMRHQENPDRYLLHPVQRRWEAWQASRAAVVVERPEKCEFAEPGGPYESGYRQGIRTMVDAIEAAGLKVLP